MALLFMDSFDHYATAGISQKWTSFAASTGGTDTSGIGAYGRRTTQGFRMAHSGTWPSKYLTKTLTVSGPTCVGGFAFEVVSGLTNIPSGGHETAGAILFRVRQGSVTQVWFQLNAAGTITAFRGPGTALGTTSVALVQGTYYYVEFKVVIANTGGLISVRVNGNSVLNLPNIDSQNTASPTWDDITIGPLLVGAPGEWWIDDVYVLDGSGPAPLNTFLGNCEVNIHKPTAEGIRAEWTPSAGINNATMVNEVPSDGDTTTVTSAGGAMDTYVVEDAPAEKAICGIQLAVLAKKNAGEGECRLATVVRSAGVNYLAVLSELGAGYAYQRVLYGTHPSSPVAWSKNAFNAAEFGYIQSVDVTVEMPAGIVSGSTVFVLGPVTFGGVDQSLTAGTLVNVSQNFPAAVDQNPTEVLFWRLDLSNMDFTTRLF